MIRANSALQLYNYSISGLSALCILWISGSLPGDPTYSFVKLASILYLSDSVLRYRVFPVKGIVSLIDTMFTIVCFIVFIAKLFRPDVLPRSITLFPVALVIRSLVAINHSRLCAKSVEVRRKTLVVESLVPKQQFNKSNAPKAILRICYVTSRIITVGSPHENSAESRYLEMKYSSLNATAPRAPSSGSVSPFSSISIIVEFCLKHLLSNPANVVSILAPHGDSSAVLIACALLLRTGAVTPPSTASRAVQLYASLSYEGDPDPSTLLSKCELSELRIFEKIMTTVNPSKQLIADTANPFPQFILKRLVLSQFDPETMKNFSLSIVEIGPYKSEHRILVDACTPSTSSTSATYLLSHQPKVADLLFVFESYDVKIMFYFNINFHLVRIVAMNNTYHYSGSLDDIADFSDPVSFSPKFELVAIQGAATSNDNDEKIFTSHVADKCVAHLIQLPQSNIHRSNTPQLNV